MNKEFIDFNKIPGTSRGGNNYCDFCQPYFTLYSVYNTTEDLKIETINSVLNQRFSEFEWLIVCCQELCESLEVLLTDNNINDSRLKVHIIDADTDNYLFIQHEARANYIVMLDCGTYIDKTFLELFYYYLEFAGKGDLLFTNCIGINTKKCVNEVLVSKRRRIINFCTKTFCIKKEKLNLIMKKTNGYYFVKGDVDFVHLNYYGVWQNQVEENNIKIKKGQFVNFPASSLYDYDTEPSGVIVRTPNLKKDKTILCMVPWCQIGGADLFNLNVIKHLSENGFTVIVISTEVCQYMGRQNMEKYTEALYDLTTFLDRRYWADFIRSVIINNGVSLIFQLSSLYGYYVIPWLKYQFPEMPIIDYLHAEDFSWRNGGYPKDANAVSGFMEKTYTCNNHLRDIMINKMKRSNIENLQTLYIGVDTKKFDPDSTICEDEETINFCSGKYVLLFPSRFSYEKRPIFLLYLMQYLHKIDDRYVCLMVGGGDAEKDIKTYVDKLHLSDCVKIIPMTLNIQQYYKLADMTIICSLTEGITLTTFESLSMNVPVITADVGGQEEVVNETNGYVIKAYQDVQKDLYNFSYSEEEIEEYAAAVQKIIENRDEMAQDKYCRNYVDKNFSQQLLFHTIENDLNYFIDKKSNVRIRADESFAIRYLVLFNETYKRYFSNSLAYEDFKGALRDRLWRHVWWRWTVKTAKYFKIDKIIKKYYFKEF